MDLEVIKQIEILRAIKFLKNCQIFFIRTPWLQIQQEKLRLKLLTILDQEKLRIILTLKNHCH